MTGGKKFRRVIGQTEMNFVSARVGRRQTACLVLKLVVTQNTGFTGPRLASTYLITVLGAHKTDDPGN